MLASLFLAYCLANPFCDRHQMHKIDVMKVFSRLNSILPLEYRNEITLVVSKEPEYNAWAQSNFGVFYKPYRITITNTLIKALDSEDLVAGVLSHEIGHILLHHIDGYAFKEQIINEFNADIVSTWVYIKAGYNICNLAVLSEKFRDLTGESIEVGDHPSWSQREFFMTFPQCK